MIEPIVIDVGEEIEYRVQFGLPCHLVLLFCLIFYVFALIFAPEMFNVKTSPNPTGALFGCLSGVMSSSIAVVYFWIGSCYGSCRIYRDKYKISIFKDKRIVEIEDIDYTFELPIKEDVEIKANVEYTVDYNICKVPIALKVKYGPYESKRIEITQKGFFDVFSFTNTVLYKKKGKKDD